ncbi:pentraxin-related protein PTX3 [Arapaima gigas]
MAVCGGLLAVCVLCLAHMRPSSGYEDMYNVKFVDQVYNEIPHGEQDEDAMMTTATPCASSELTKWDKLFSMLENSQMRENMLLESADDVLRAELHSLRSELQQHVDNLAVTCCNRVDGAGRHFATQLELRLERSLHQLLGAVRGLESHSTKVEASCQNGRGSKVLLNDINAGDTGQLEKMLAAMATELHKVQTQLNFTLRSMAQSSVPSGCEMSLLFPMRSRRIVATVMPDAAMSLRAFTVCLWAKATDTLNKTVLFSYGTRLNPYEIQLLLSGTAALFTVAGEAHLVEASQVVELGRWAHYCGAWSSDQGLASLWVDGQQVASSPGVAEGHTLPEKGVMQLGQEKNGCCAAPGFEDSFDAKLAFTGRMTGVNMWDRMLGADEISQQARWESACSSRGNIVGWGVSEIKPHGGAQFNG